MNQPILSIIIISFNTIELTKKSIQTILQSKLLIKYEIIVVDNASTDNSPALLNSTFSNYLNIRIIKNNQNIGFAKANNQGVKEAHGTYILFLNSDTEILENSVQKLFTYYTQHEKTIQFLGGKLFNKDMTSQPSCGPFYTLPVVFGALFLKGDYWGLTRYSPSNLKEVDWISGSCILTKRNYFEQLHGFDEQIFMYMDEIDLLYRAKKHGFHVFFYPEAHFIHLGSASSGSKTYPILQVYHGFMYFYRKHYPKLAVFFLIYLLQLKAVVSIMIGKMTRNHYLIETYEKAYAITQKD